MFKFRRKRGFKPQDSKFMRNIKLKNLFLGSFAMMAVVVMLVVYFLYYEIPKQNDITLASYISDHDLTGKVLILSEDILPGESIEGKYEAAQIKLEIIPSDALVTITTGRSSKINLSKNTIITMGNTVNCEYVITDDLRRENLQGIDFPEDLVVGASVDIKYFDGERDWIVLAKKEVLMIASGKIWFNLEPGESKLFKKAFKERTFVGGALYVSTYIDPQNQAAAHVDFIPAEERAVVKIKTDQEIEKSNEMEGGVLDEEKGQHNIVQ